MPFGVSDFYFLLGNSYTYFWRRSTRLALFFAWLQHTHMTLCSIRPCTIFVTTLRSLGIPQLPTSASCK